MIYQKSNSKSVNEALCKINKNNKNYDLYIKLNKNNKIVYEYYTTENDYIVYLSNKMNDVTSAYIDEYGNRVNKNEDIELYDGSIINAFNYENIKSK